MGCADCEDYMDCVDCDDCMDCIDCMDCAELPSAALRLPTVGQRERLVLQNTRAHVGVDCVWVAAEEADAFVPEEQERDARTLGHPGLGIGPVLYTDQTLILRALRGAPTMTTTTP